MNIIHQYLWYNRNTLPQIHWNNLSCSFLPDGHFLCNMTMLESSLEPGRFDSVFFTPDLFTFIKTNDVCWVLWNSRKNNKTSLQYVVFFDSNIRSAVKFHYNGLIWLNEYVKNEILYLLLIFYGCFMGDYAFEHNDLMKYSWTCMQCCESNIYAKSSQIFYKSLNVG